jgi:hypothetical protein
MDKRILGRAYSRLIHKYFLNDMYLDTRLRAKQDTVDYIEANPKDALLCQGRKALIEQCMRREREAALNGLILEFVAADAITYRYIGFSTMRYRAAVQITGIVRSGPPPVARSVGEPLRRKRGGG